MTQTMVEQVARAICKRRNTGQCAAWCLSYSSLQTGNGQCPGVMIVWGEDAKAAIEAMREPSEAMLATTATVERSHLRTIWQSMIDAALKEKPGE